MIRIICIGKIKDKDVNSIVSDYLKRIQIFHKCEIVELKDYPNSKTDGLNQLVIQQESDSILQRISSDDYVILLDLKGNYLTSEELSLQIETALNQSYKAICFIIGGSLGVSDDLRVRANIIWKLSNNTFPHQLVRILVLEQIYRGFKIMHHHTYHK